MRINTFEFESTKIFQGILLALLTHQLPFPWWKWALYVGSVIGITMRWSK